MIIQKVKYIRHGKCEPDKCGSLCCRQMQNPSKECINIFKPNKDGICQYLVNNRCTIYANRPEVCEKFPSERCPYHPNYLKVKDKCTFRFEEVREIKDEK